MPSSCYSLPLTSPTELCFDQSGQARTTQADKERLASPLRHLITDHLAVESTAVAGEHVRTSDLSHPVLPVHRIMWYGWSEPLIPTLTLEARQETSRLADLAAFIGLPP